MIANFNKKSPSSPQAIHNQFSLILHFPTTLTIIKFKYIN